MVLERRVRARRRRTVVEAEAEARRLMVVVAEEVAWGRRSTGLAGGEEPAVAVAAEISMVVAGGLGLCVEEGRRSRWGVGGGGGYRGLAAAVWGLVFTCCDCQGDARTRKEEGAR
uniref:Uncharacterized protein n=1 Tax=Triticum urartu TaxID=4572 RepID=A0A8R7P5H0_TRIUA